MNGSAIATTTSSSTSRDAAHLAAHLIPAIELLIDVQAGDELVVEKNASLLDVVRVAVQGLEAVEGKEYFVESDPLTPTCTYAATKIASELAIRKADNNYTVMRIGSTMDFRAPHMAMMADPDYLARTVKESRLKSSESPGHFVSADDVNTAYLNALDNPESDRRTFNLVGPTDCRTTFRSMQDDVSVALGGSPTPDDDWGSGPYPQHYYDPEPSDRVLHYVRTGRAGIIANMQNALGDIAEFMSLSS